jgi:hypothetical protein
VKNVVMLVTPEKAGKFLEMNTDNRPVRSSWVNQLVGAITRGEWKTSHQGIAISKTGRLLDGQHRLMAIAQAGVPCMVNVALDVDDASTVCMDIGAKRNLDDIFNLGRDVSEVLRFAAKLVLQNVPTPQQVSIFIDTDFHNSAKLLHEYCGTSVKVYSSAPMRFAAVFRHVESIKNHRHQEIIFQQYRALCLHDFNEMDETSKSYVKSIMSSGNGAIIDQVTRFGHGLKAFNPKARNFVRFRMQESEFRSSVAEAREYIRSYLKGELL